MGNGEKVIWEKIDVSPHKLYLAWLLLLGEIVIKTKGDTCTHIHNHPQSYHNHTTAHIITYTIIQSLSHTINLTYTVTHIHKISHNHSHKSCTQSYTQPYTITHTQFYTCTTHATTQSFTHTQLHTHTHTPIPNSLLPRSFFLNLILKMSSNGHWEEHSGPNWYKANLSSPLIHMKF